MEELFWVWKLTYVIFMVLIALYTVIKSFFSLEKEDADKIVKFAAILTIIYTWGIAVFLMLCKTGPFFSVVMPCTITVMLILTISTTKDDFLPPFAPVTLLLVVTVIFIWPLNVASDSFMDTNTGSIEITQEVEYDEEDFERLYNGESDDMMLLTIYNMCNEVNGYNE